MIYLIGLGLPALIAVILFIVSLRKSKKLQQTKGSNNSADKSDKLPAPYCYFMNHEWEKLNKYLEDTSDELPAFPKTQTGDTIWHFAAGCDAPIEIMEILYRADPDIDACNTEGDTPLHFAAMMGCREQALFLLEKGVFTDTFGKYGETPLHRAVFPGREEIASLLIDAGADIEARQEDGLTPLHVAVIRGDFNMIKFLIKHKALAHSSDNKGAMIIAAAKTNIWSPEKDSRRNEIIDLLEKNGARFSDDNSTNIARAIIDSDFKKAGSLILSGISPDFYFSIGTTPIHMSVEELEIKLLDTIISCGGSIDARDYEGDSPLLIAARNSDNPEYLPLIDKLIKKSADVNAVNNTGNSAMHYLAYKGHLKQVEALLKKGASANIRDRKIKATPLHSAAIKGNTKMVKLLLKNGADPSIRDAMLKLPADYAHENGFTGIEKILTPAAGNKEHAAVSVPGNPFEIFREALHRGDTSTINKMLDSKIITVTSRDAKNGTLLLYAVLEKQIESVKILLEYGADADAPSMHGFTPLMAAIEADDAAIVKMLIKKGKADINIRNEQGATALHTAASLGKKNMVRILLDAGASADIKDNTDLLEKITEQKRAEGKELLYTAGNSDMLKGVTAAQVARICGHPEISDMIEKHGTNS